MPTFTMAVYLTDQETPFYIAHKKQVDEASRKAAKKELKKIQKANNENLRN